MKRLSATLLGIGLATAVVATASAQTYGGYNTNGGSNAYGNNNTYDTRDNAVYDWARVVRVDPVIANNGYSNNGYANNGYSNNGYSNTNGQHCYESNNRYGNGGYVQNGTYRSGPYYPQQQSGYGTETGRTVATVVGGIAGAVLGSKVGGGSGAYAASAIGTMVGGLAGRQIYDSAQRRRYAGNTVQVCDPVRRQRLRQQWLQQQRLQQQRLREQRRQRQPRGRLRRDVRIHGPPVTSRAPTTTRAIASGCGSTCVRVTRAGGGRRRLRPFSFRRSIRPVDVAVDDGAHAAARPHFAVGVDFQFDDRVVADLAPWLMR
jgi:hypothetical protein